jgi:hypothetical protein
MAESTHNGKPVRLKVSTKERLQAYWTINQRITYDELINLALDALEREQRSNGQ